MVPIGYIDRDRGDTKMWRHIRQNVVSPVMGFAAMTFTPHILPFSRAPLTLHPVLLTGSMFAIPLHVNGSTSQSALVPGIIKTR